MRLRLLLSVLFSLVVLANGNLLGQNTIQVDGFVRDSITKEALPFVAVALKGTSIGVNTKDDGSFSFRATSDSLMLVVSYVGFETKFIPLRRGSNRLDILLEPISYQLDELIIRPGRERYSRRENPAVEFVQNVISRRDLHNPKLHDYYSYNMYEQRTFAFDDFDVEKARQNWMYRKFDFVLDYVDSTSVRGRTVLPIYNEETIENYYFRKSPQAERKVVQGYTSAGLFELFAEDNIKQFIGESFKDVDIFQDNIPLFLNRFVSPLSSIGPIYYRYYILDTLEIDNELCMDLGFAPFNSESFGFVGHLYVTLDSTYFIKKAILNTPRDINLNFVGEMSILQEFMRTSTDSTRILTKNDMVMTFKMSKNQSGTYARRVALYRNHSFEMPVNSAIFAERNPAMESEGARRQTEDFWNNAREGSSEIQATSVERMMAQLREVPAFYWTEKALNAFINGYIQTSDTHSKFEIGPVNTFFSGNALEGFRLRTGGTTTVNLSDQLFLDGYMAYGFKDQKLKGDAIFEYSLNKKRSFRKEYPFHYLRAEYKYDINQIGQQYMYTNPDNVFMMPKRRVNNLLTYMQSAELSYYHENYKGFAYSVMLRHQKEWATPDVPFSMIQADGTTLTADHYTSAQLVFFVRWAPNEKFYQSRNYRYPITLDAPIITLKHTMARKGILGTDHNYNKTDLGVRKRFWLSPFGYIDIYGQAGKVWDRVPYPLLHIPNANLSYSVEEESFPLMDPMEFIHDRYVSWETTYHLNGLLFNRLPLIKKLQLREVVSFRGWYGDLSDRNNPDKNGVGLYQFPSTTYMMGDKPYMEIGAGIENVFKLIRIDYVWRLSYRDHIGTPNGGLRFKMVFGF
ncbi:MAG: DUF5686 and carboxypeptidase regulatory-like domain-containing protein [Tannerella sp.]|jgi:hypothetical protein|nr:DUF5686 and carboxypeptidase regulatory-like domain-containing protein [Tannerella sp.]